MALTYPTYHELMADVGQYAANESAASSVANASLYMNVALTEAANTINNNADDLILDLFI